MNYRLSIFTKTLNQFQYVNWTIPRLTLRIQHTIHKPLRETPEIEPEYDIDDFDERFLVHNVSRKKNEKLAYYLNITCEYHPDYK